MEFPFNVNHFLKQKITKVRQNLLPEGFSGDRRSAWDCTSKISDILDEMGRASAVAQGLQKAITSGERLRNSEQQTIYLLTDPEGKSGQGTVVGLLKVGRKKLFVFDAAGAHHEVLPLCVLDFYVHESKQRMGCGKTLYEYMLMEETTSPQYLAIDRPSEKFLGFLFKHYGLEKILPQTNNFVVYEGFFINNPDKVNSGSTRMLQSRSPNLYTSDFQSRPAAVRNSQTEEKCNGMQQSSFGRYAAHRPQSTIGKILQNPGSQQQQHNGGTSQPLSHFMFDEVCGPPVSPAGDCGISEVNNSPPKSYIMELNAEVNSTSTASCRQHHSTSPVKLDLKFHHSPLW